MSTASFTLGRARYPVVLPSVRDPRLHVAAVIVTIHVLGQVSLGFQVSVPQILAAILTCAVIEVAITFRSRRAFVWPASAMLTGSGVALILRVPSTPPGEHWSTHAWWVFAGVAALSLATKYLVRYRGSHLFNPSNIGLVIVFIVFGSTRLEPLDFWWAPPDAGMMTAYAVIVCGGLLITARLGLLAVAATFWITIAAGLALLAASGHCMVARWSFAPVCDADYWRAVALSPELLVFMFFMITDPKTVPSGRRGRIVFGFSVAAICTLLMAPQTTEFATKVALLAGLAIACAGRPVLDRLLPRLPQRRVLRGMAFVGCVGVLAVAILAAGASSREDRAAAAELDGVARTINPATFPSISVDQDVLDWNHEISGAGARDVVLTLAENLDVESQALLRSDAALLEAVDHGDRLDEMRARLQLAAVSGTVVVDHYQIDDVHVTLIVPFGKQDGLSLGLRTRGTVTRETRDGDGQVQERTSSPFETTFVVRRATGGRWLNVAVLPTGRP